MCLLQSIVENTYHHAPEANSAQLELCKSLSASIVEKAMPLPLFGLVSRESPMLRKEDALSWGLPNTNI
jgi:hypothetical protein